jgi:hypothetical protein
MQFQAYSVAYTDHGPVIQVQTRELREQVCSTCHASFLPTFGPDICPYCGESGTYLSLEEWLLYSDMPDWYVPVSEQGAGAYTKDIRGIIRAMWQGKMDYDQAWVQMLLTIELGLTAAWYEGALLCKVSPSELSPDERMELRDVIHKEQTYITNLLSFVDANSKANGGKLKSVLPRADTWGLRYADVVNRAKLMACADQKLQWTINYVRKVKQNCKSCLKLDGKVKRTSYWAREEVQPQNPPNPKLDCGGWT